MLNITKRWEQLLGSKTQQELEETFIRQHGESYPLEMFKWEIQHKIDVHGSSYYREELAFYIAHKELELEGIDPVGKIAD